MNFAAKVNSVTNVFIAIVMTFAMIMFKIVQVQSSLLSASEKSKRQNIGC